MNRRNQLIILGIVIAALVISAIIFSLLRNDDSIKVGFDNISDYNGKRITIEGFLGENISLQQHILSGKTDVSRNQYFFLDSSEKSPNEKIILVFENNDFPYIDKGAFIRVTGKVDVTDSGEVYLDVAKIN
jgi:ABC-type antimicrobial peptide transport system permease subunit